MDNNIDIPSESTLLSSIFQYGCKVYDDINDITSIESFQLDAHQFIFKSLQQVFKLHPELQSVDIPTFLGAANVVGLSQFFDKKDELKYLKSLYNFPVNQETGRIFAVKLLKLRLIRKAVEDTELQKQKLINLTGDETLNDIVSITEETSNNLANSVNGIEDDGPKEIFAEIEEYVKYIEENPVQQIGISTGYSRLDASWGGGLINGLVAVLAARMKVGKTFFGDNVAYNVICQGLPCLVACSEMTIAQRRNRMLSRVSSVDLSLLKTGRYKDNPILKQRVHEAAKKLKSLRYTFLSITKKSTKEILAGIRRWLMKRVGLGNPCVVVLDYLKLTSNDNLYRNVKEYQEIGFILMDIIDLAIKYNIPFLNLCQLNRDGIDSVETNTIAGSDRIAMYCSSLSLLRKQSRDEIAAQSGNRKIYNRKAITIFSREAEEMDENNYINFLLTNTGLIEEGPTFFEMEEERRLAGMDGVISEELPSDERL